MKNRSQVAVIGDARLESKEAYELAFNVGSLIHRLGFHLVCGGLGGVMEASCKGHKHLPNSYSTIGILPSYDHASSNPYVDIVIPTGLDVGRNQLVVASSFAVVVIGGGAGTLSEIALASQINKPIILMKGTGGWADKLTMDYLDQRQNVRLFHISTIEELEVTLSSLSSEIDRSGKINSGHNR